MDTEIEKPVPDDGMIPQANAEGSDYLRMLFKTAKTHLPDMFAGSRFGKYLIRQVISENNGAWLVRAEDPILNRTVVLKIDSDDSAERTLQNAATEGRAIAAVNHPNIVHVWGVESFQGRQFLVLEHIEGITLEEFCATRPVCEATALDIAKQIAEGLVAIHRRGLLHLDLKPSNIMITREGVAKIIDFGLSRRIDEISFDEIAGTPGYLAPERSADTPDKLGIATDVFGIGAVVYRMLTTHSPFAGDTKSEKVLNSARGKLADSKWGRWKVSRGTRSLVDNCLKRSPEHRPKTAEAVIKRIQLNQRQLLFRKLFIAGLAFACCLLLFASLFPDHVISARSLLTAQPDITSKTPLVVMMDGGLEFRASKLSETSDSDPDNSHSRVFERLHDDIQKFTSRHLKLGEFPLAKKVQSRAAGVVKKYFPDAVDYKRNCETHAAIFESLAMLPEEAQWEISKAVKGTCIPLKENDSLTPPESQSRTRLLERSFQTSKHILGADHGWTLMCQGEHLVAQLLDPTQPLPPMPEFDFVTERLHSLYRGASRLETELHFQLSHRLRKKLKQQSNDHLTLATSSESKKKQDPILKLFNKHSRKSVLLAQEYYQGRHNQQAFILSSFCNFEYFRLGQKDRAVEYSKKVVRICEDEAGTASNCMIQALLILAEHRIEATEYGTALGHLRQARSIARHLVDDTSDPNSVSAESQATFSRTLLDLCNEKIANLFLLSKPSSNSEKQL